MQLFAQPKSEDLAVAAATASMRSAQLVAGLLGPFDSADHETWCQSATCEPLSVQVGTPESRGSYLAKHTTFLVTLSSTGGINASVRRRYSDFAWLRSVLRARYVGLLVPSLPEKSSVAAVAAIRAAPASTAVLMARARGLTLFLSAVLASPYLRSDAAVLGFLSAEDNDWESAKKETAVLDNAGIGHLRWLHRVLNARIESSPDKAIEEFKREVEQQEKMTSELVVAAKRLADRSAARAKDVAALHTAFSSWQSTASAGLCEDNKALASLLGSSTNAIGGWSQLAQFQPAVHELLLLEGIRYVHHQASDLKELLVEREQLLLADTPPEEKPKPAATYSTAMALNLSSQLASRLRGASITELSAAEVESKKRRDGHLTSLMTRALMGGEIRRFRMEQTRALKELMAQLACAEGQMAKRASSLWREYLKATDANHDALVASTKQVLDGAVGQYAAPEAPAAAGAAASADAF